MADHLGDMLPSADSIHPKVTYHKACHIQKQTSECSKTF